jgi:hypothetical protein
MGTKKIIDTDSRYNDGTWAIRLVHFNRGWRYWAFLITEGSAIGGLSVDGYDTMAEAKSALFDEQKR